MTHRLRIAVPEDGPAIARILSNWIDETPWMPRIHSHDEDRAFGSLLIEKSSVTVAEGPQRSVIGFLAERDGTIEALYVDEAFRASGVGTALVDEAQKTSKSLDLWVFQANAPARKFYEKMGFGEVEFTDGSGNDESLPDVRMVWDQNPADVEGTAETRQKEPT